MFFFYHLVNLQTILSYEIGILAIFTLFFTFVGIKSEVNKKFDTMLKRNGQKNEVGSELTPEQIDIVNTRINKRRTSILGLLDDMGRTFRINIYSGLVSIVFLFILLKIQDDFPKTSGAFESSHPPFLANQRGFVKWWRVTKDFMFLSLSDSRTFR